MEYEIYYLCNLLGLILVFGIILFHFVDADKKPKTGDINTKAKETKIIK